MSTIKNTQEILLYKSSLLLKTQTAENVLYFKKLQTPSSLLKLNTSSDFLGTLKSQLPQKLRVTKKKLFLKGLGYKVIFENGFLSFKLNLSHELKLKLPSFIKRVIINKTNLVFESYDSILLGNFVESIYNLKPKNPYGGKGFSLKSKVVPLKEVKKKK
jgi:hypothetical protein